MNEQPANLNTMKFHLRELHTGRKQVEWTDEMKATLTRLINEDRMSIGQAAKAMGLNRNQVAGKCRVLGLKTKTECKFRPPVRKGEPRLKVLPKKELAKRPARQKPRIAFVERQSPPPVWKGEFPPGTAVYPSHWKCQWIEARDKCGAERVPGRPYCHAHCLRAYDLASIARMEARK